MQLTVNVIIITVLCVIVLISVTGLLLTKSASLTSCESKGGFCARLCSNGFLAYPVSTNCPEEINLCCIISAESPKSNIIKGGLFP